MPLRERTQQNPRQSSPISSVNRESQATEANQGPEEHTSAGGGAAQGSIDIGIYNLH